MNLTPTQIQADALLRINRDARDLSERALLTFFAQSPSAPDAHLDRMFEAFERAAKAVAGLRALNAAIAEAKASADYVAGDADRRVKAA